MAKSALAGQLRTKITVMAVNRTVDSDGYPSEDEADVFGCPVWCKWVNAHGTEVFEGLRLDLKEPATITMRYSDKVTQKCLIYRDGDDAPYEVISIDNVENKREWLELKVQRRVTA